MDKSESESVIADENSKEESKSKSGHKSIKINKEKYEINEIENKETSIEYNTVINKPSYFNLFECGKNLLNKFDATCERACMATSRDK